VRAALGCILLELNESREEKVRASWQGVLACCRRPNEGKREEARASLPVCQAGKEACGPLGGRAVDLASRRSAAFLIVWKPPGRGNERWRH
jgi:hypothetical protein